MFNKKLVTPVVRALIAQGVFHKVTSNDAKIPTNTNTHHKNTTPLLASFSTMSTKYYPFLGTKASKIVATSAISPTMMNQLTNVNSLQSPNEYYASHKEMGIAPDGVGLQILFDTGAEHYQLVIGPRAGKLLTVIGGAINNSSQSFLEQLKEEFKEETFGELTLDTIGNKIYLHVKRYNKTCLLEFQEDKSYLAGKQNKYAYVTFSAICKDLTSKELHELADTLSPTAQFWNKIGNFLFSQSGPVSKCKNDQAFLDYWTADEQCKARAKLKEELMKDYAANKSQLLVSPLTVFGQKDIQSALNTLDQIQNAKHFNKVFRHDVGRYSERSGFQVYTATALLEQAQANKLFNSAAAASTLEAILNDTPSQSFHSATAGW